MKKMKNERAFTGDTSCGGFFHLEVENWVLLFLAIFSDIV